MTIFNYDRLPMGITWKRFWKLFLSNLGISLILSCGIWKWVLGKDFNIGFYYINIDFFNTLGVVFTIIGLIIAIFQIAELRTQQEIRQQTIEQFKIHYFKTDAIYNLGFVKPKVQLLQQEINGEFQFSEAIIYSYIESLNSVNHILGNINSQQQNIGCDVIIECGKLITLLEEIDGDLHNVATQKSFTSFPKQHFNSKIGELITSISDCEAKLKS